MHYLVPRPKSWMRIAATLARLPRYLRLAQRLMADPQISKRRKIALGAGVVYVALPVDLVPGVIPVIGGMDDLTALLLGLRTALRGCSPESARAHLEHVGLNEVDLDGDLQSIRAAAIWLASRGARAGGLLASGALTALAGVTSQARQKIPELLHRRG